MNEHDDEAQEAPLSEASFDDLERWASSVAYRSVAAMCRNDMATAMREAKSLRELQDEYLRRVEDGDGDGANKDYFNELNDLRMTR